jgi:dTDP-4-dehydrorhamnose reductase
MNVLLLGGSGQLGREIASRWTGDSIVAPSHAELDIADSDRAQSWIEKTRANIVVNCAAFHNVDVCESEPAEAFRVNALAVDAWANACAAAGIAFMTISTDYVFDGESDRPYTEEDCARPISAYGASKRAGESLVLRREMNAFVVRTCGVYGIYASQSKGTFIDRIIREARAGEKIRIVSDVVASPTYAGHLAEALRALIDTGSYGLYHACNSGPVSWFDFASKALELAGIDHPIEPISSTQWKAAARRPAYSALANARLERIGIAMPPWYAGIAAYLQDKAF